MFIWLVVYSLAYLSYLYFASLELLLVKIQWVTTENNESRNCDMSFILLIHASASEDSRYNKDGNTKLLKAESVTEIRKME